MKMLKPMRFNDIVENMMWMGDIRKVRVAIGKDFGKYGVYVVAENKQFYKFFLVAEYDDVESAKKTAENTFQNVKMHYTYRAEKWF